MNGKWFAAIVLAAAVASGSELRPSVRPLPLEAGQYVADVSWQNGSILIATEKGVYAHTADGKTAPASVVGVKKIPEGIPSPDSVSSNGQYSIATALVPPSNYGWRTNDRTRVWAEQMTPIVGFDVVLTGTKTCVLGRRFHPKDPKTTGVAVWCGPLGKPWAFFEPLHSLRSGAGAVKIFRSSVFHQAGAIVADDNGTINVVTSAEPGVFRYAADGKLIEVLGGNVDELVLDRAAEIVERFAADMPGRYRSILNTQPIIDDLVVTPSGPAIVVRVPEKQTIRWELWYPEAGGGIRQKTVLGVRRNGPYGHLRCATRARKLACVTSLPPETQAAVLPGAQRFPHLLLFDLPVAQQKLSASR